VPLQAFATYRCETLAHALDGFNARGRILQRNKGLSDDPKTKDSDRNHEHHHRKRDMFQRLQYSALQSGARLEMAEGQPIEKDHRREQQERADQPDLPQTANEPARHRIPAHHAAVSLRI
jgi:hypothetical protein